MSRAGDAGRIRGAVDAEGRCRHWHGEHDVLAIRLPCCKPFWACHACHEELAGHPAQRWPVQGRDADALLCGACGARFPIATHLAAPDACPGCARTFNPGCRLHHGLYFEPVAKDAT